MPYPAGTPDYTRYTINEYNTVGNRIKPPFTVIVKYDLNQPGISGGFRMATIRSWPPRASPARACPAFRTASS